MDKVEDLSLPLCTITKIIQEELPDSVGITKDARSAISNAASIFILYLTSSSNTLAVRAKRKTIMASDVFETLREMELECMIPILEQLLASLRDGGECTVRTRASGASSGASSSPSRHTAPATASSAVPPSTHSASGSPSASPSPAAMPYAYSTSRPWVPIFPPPSKRARTNPLLEDEAYDAGDVVDEEDGEGGAPRDQHEWRDDPDEDADYDPSHDL